MANRDQALKTMLLNGYSPDEAEAMLDEMKAKSAKPAAVPAPQRRMASADKPAGGPVGTVTKKVAAAAKEPVVAPPPQSPAGQNRDSPDDLKAASTIGYKAAREQRALDPQTAVGKGVKAVIEGNKLRAEIASSAVAGLPAAADYMFGSGFAYGLPGSDWRAKREAASDRAVARQKAEWDAYQERATVGNARISREFGEAAADVRAILLPSDTYMDTPPPAVAPKQAPSRALGPVAPPTEADDRALLTAAGYADDEIAALPTSAARAAAAAKLRATR